MLSDEPLWWRHAVVYQVYIRSFADGNGDGMGDIAGLRSRLDHIASLGADAIWINPWYPSPQADAGYDVITFTDIDPRFGTLADAEVLISEAHDRNIRVLLDIVPNHSSDQHEWFRAALAAGPGSPERERFIFREGRSEHGELPPNNWRACFGGPAWTRVIEADGRPGQWYLHLFAPQQPDRNWEHPDTLAEHEATLRFWFDRGVDGFRIDVAHALFKAPGLPDVPPGEWRFGEMEGHPFWDQEGVHEVYRTWRRIADSYDPPRVFVAEAWVPKPSRLARYVRRDELHTTFNFDFLRSPWRADSFRAVIDSTLAEHALVGAPATWVLSNHDVLRHVSRYARLEQHDRSSDQLRDFRNDAADPAVGQRRARAAIMLMAALPGCCYVYQGEEFGLPEVEDLPPEVLQDPTWERSGFTDTGRDGCRVPVPWSGTASPFGFSPEAATGAPWLPQPAWFAHYTMESEDGVEGSMLEHYRTVLHLRRELSALGDGPFEWLDSPEGSLAFTRVPGFVCVVNFGHDPLRLDGSLRVVLSSSPLTADGEVPTDTAVWLAE